MVPLVSSPVRTPARTRVACASAAVFAIAAALVPTPSRADVVTAMDGTTYEGKVVSQDDATVVIETTFDGRKEIPRSQVKDVDTRTPPLREQLAYRLGAAKDAPALLDVASWAKAKGFTKELDDVWRKVLEVDPKNAKAHKSLGHVKVGDAWMTPEEKAAADKAAEEAAQRAKGLVPHQGRWVTPQEKEALEKGLIKDGDVWVTEDEWHARRGEKKVDGQWVRVGEKEAKERAAVIGKATGTTLAVHWSPHVDLLTEVEDKDAKPVLEAAEKAVAAFLAIVKPEPSEPVNEIRIQVVLFQKSTAYGRFVAFFDKEQQIASMGGPMETWAKRTAKERAFWWAEAPCTSGHYLFPNTPKVVGSNAAHDVAQILLTRWRYNYAFPSWWLLEAVSYLVEVEAQGFSASFNVGKGGGAGTGSGDPTEWTESEKWKTSLKTLVAAGQDTPFSRIAKAQFGQFSMTDLVKCWSVVDYLHKSDPAKFRAFLEGSKGKGVVEEDALKKAYGLDYAGVDAKWRAFVQGGFKSP